MKTAQKPHQTEGGPTKLVELVICYNWQELIIWWWREYQSHVNALYTACGNTLGKLTYPRLKPQIYEDLQDQLTHMHKKSKWNNSQHSSIKVAFSQNMEDFAVKSKQNVKNWTLYHFSNIYTYISTEAKWQVIKTHFTNTYSTNIYHSYYVSWEETHSLVDERLWVLLGVADFEISLIIQENSHKTLPWLWRKCQRLNFYAVFIPFQYSHHLNLIHLNYQCICLWIVVKC